MANTSDTPTHDSSPDPHHHWWAERERLRAQYGVTDAVVVADRAVTLAELIAETPASSIYGAATQLRLAVRCLKEGAELGPYEEQALENALSTLDRLASPAD